MTANHDSLDESRFAVPLNQPLLGIVSIEDGKEVIRYFVDESKTDAAVVAQLVADARALAGAWSDCNWDETVDALDRIRRSSRPTPPIDAL